MIVSLIAAVAKNNVIGANGDLPWNLPRDMKFFTSKTKGHHVIMGRKNYESIPSKYRPLPLRPNLVVTRNQSYSDQGIHVFHSIEDALKFAEEAGEEEAFIIGGGEIYSQAIAMADRMYITHVDAHLDGDTFYPDFEVDHWTSNLLLEQEQDHVHNHSFKTYVYNRID